MYCSPEGTQRDEKSLPSVRLSALHSRWQRRIEASLCKVRRVHDRSRHFGKEKAPTRFLLPTKQRESCHEARLGPFCLRIGSIASSWSARVTIWGPDSPDLPREASNILRMVCLRVPDGHENMLSDAGLCQISRSARHKIAYRGL